MNGPRLKSGGLTHTLRRASGRRRQENIHPLHLKIADDGIDGCGLTGSRSSRYDQKAIAHCLLDRLHLMLIQIHLRLLFNLSKAHLDLNIRYIVADIQLLQHSCSIRLHIEKGAGINLCDAIHLTHDDLAVHGKIHIMILYVLRLQTQKLRRSPCQLLHRQIGMPLPRCLKQSILNSASNTKIRVRPDSHPGRNLVRGPEPYAFDIIRHTVRILLQDSIDFLPILVIYFHRQRRADSILLEKNHRLS